MTIYRNYNVEIWTEDINEVTSTVFSNIICYDKIEDILYETLIFLAEKSSDKSEPYIESWIRKKYNEKTACKIIKNRDGETYRSEIRDAMKQLSIMLRSNGISHKESYAKLGKVDLHVLISECEEK